MNVAIFGVNQVSLIVADVINRAYNSWLNQRLGENIKVTAFIAAGAIPPDSGSVGDVAILNPSQFAALYRQKYIDKIIFPCEHCIGQQELFTNLQLLGVNVDDMYITGRLAESIDIQNFFEPYVSAKYLPYLEFHIADHCNMNCKYCTHYSGLVKKPKFTNLEKFTRDFVQLHKFIEDIGRIRILGGEPLLNPEVDEYVKLCRRLYPLSEIFVVTNGILLPKMPEKFFDTLRENNAIVLISFYPTIKSKIVEIQNLLKRKGVNLIITPLIENFTATQTLKRHDYGRQMFLQCPTAHCYSLYEGKIVICPLSFTTKYFNAYYGKNLPEDGALDLYEEGLTTEKLKRFLLTPFERCRYCTPPVAVKWEPVKYPSPITDWTNDHLVTQKLS